MIKAYWEIEVYDKNGKLISKHRQPCRSLLANFIRILRGMLLAKGGTALTSYGVKASCSVKKYDGTEDTAYTEWYGSLSYGIFTCAGSKSADNDDSYGIMVGSGTKTVEIDDYSLESKISHGTGSGQLDYDTHTINKYEEAGQVKIEIQRTFRNVSGATITVKEVGLGVRNYCEDGDGVKKDLKFLIVRDLLDTPRDVLDGGSLTVKITIIVPTG
ncbi:MAG: hypothetical protein B6U75_03485 [Desulfurococcales archaeon ex4484_217_1]|nr:MAG: hypothetical protein B6U75_03485 [Desulfurococcales archaeon ex4484_217_1]